MMKLASILLLTILSFSLCAQEIPDHEGNFKFLENKGQWPDFVLFRAESKYGKMYVEQGRILYQFVDMKEMRHAHFNEVETAPDLKQELIIARFQGANEVTAIKKTKPSREYYNFFIGNDPDRWASEVRGYADIVLNELYEGIDLRLNNEGDVLKYDFIVAPHASPDQIRIEYPNAEKVLLTKDGGLRVKGKLGLIEEKKPYVYQVRNGKIVEIPAAYRLEGNIVTYELEEYDEALELIIDPAMIFASYSGSESDNFGMTATYDSNGSLYSGGIAFGNSYPTTAGAYDENGTFTQVNAAANQSLRYGITDIFISKYSADGTTMVYSTYIGGGDDFGGTEVPHSIICNDNNELYFFGTTSSDDFPLVNPVQAVFNGGLYREFTSNGTHFWGSDGTTNSGGTDLVVGKLSSDGSTLMGATYIGGSANDGLNYNESGAVNGNFFGGLLYNYGDPYRGEIMLDDAGNCYVVSCTYSTDFPLVNAAQPTYGGAMDGVIMKFSPDLATLLQSTYWGGNGRDACYAIKFDSNNSIYVAGGTRSGDFTTTPGVIQPNHNGVTQPDGFITKFDASGTSVLSSTLLGTPAYDQAFFLQIDRYDDVFVLGQTTGSITPSAGVYGNPNSGQFIMQLTTDLDNVIRQTVFGNGNSLVNISPTAFLVDVCGNLYVSGWGAGIAGSLQQGSPLSGMPVTSDAYQQNHGDGYNFYLIVLSREMGGLLYGSYLGGGQAQEHVDGGTSRFDEMGIVYHSACGGCGGHSDFQTFPPDVWSLTNESDNCNNLVFKFDLEIVPKAEFTVDHTEGCAPFTVQFQNFSSDSTNYEWDFGDGVTSTTDYNPIYTFNTPGTYEVTLYVQDTICLLTDSAKVYVTVHDSLLLDITPDTIVCGAAQVQLWANSYGTGDTFLWSSQPDFSDTLNSYPTDSLATVFPDEDATYYVQVTNAWCTRTDSMQVIFLSEVLTYDYPDTVCAGDSFSITAINSLPSVSFTFDWAPDSVIVSGDGGSTITVLLEESQEITVEATTSTGCSLYDTLYITVTDLDETQLSAFAEPDTLPVGGQTTLTGEAPSGVTTSWIPPGQVSSPGSLITTATVYEDTDFYFVVSDGYCTKTVLVPVKALEFICDEPYVFVPNAFTPDNDKTNDILYVRGPYVFEMIFRIYNRWGEMVFESTDQSSGWDGTFKGRACDPDVYDYYLDVKCIDGQQSIIKGNVTLIR
ncbi:hypothetical protein GCM10009118_09980 [Wandonia haliotis]|uniref:PKD domain-containing protein n=1 Tax=Wandonia haliotis TaxID=574963 RepID=A0ABN1MND2_9FLAO